jgi:hypothetical protein
MSSQGKKRIVPQNPPPPPITAENYRPDLEIRELLISWGHNLDAPKPKGNGKPSRDTTA